jgi:DDE superfamily endonuclease
MRRRSEAGSRTPGRGQGNTAWLEATLAFFFESALLMAPLMGRTLVPRGETPILRQLTPLRQEVSAAGVVTISPKRHHLGLYVAFYPNQDITAAVLVDFLPALRCHVRRPLVLIWGRLATHRARSTNAFPPRRPQIHTVLLPPYAPELSAVKYVWGYFEGGPLPNHAPDTADEPARSAAQHARTVAGRDCVLRGFVRAAGLPSRLGGARRGHSGTPPRRRASARAPAESGACTAQVRGAVRGRADPASLDRST